MEEYIFSLFFIIQTVGLSSWHTRVAVLHYIQVMVFCNFFTMLKPEYQDHVRETVLHLICDDQLEVSCVFGKEFFLEKGQ